jgi:two-component system alkaline phosphatase synthesis response regulator PhoP
MSGARILVVEDNRSLREGLAMNLKLNGYTPLTAADGETGMQLAFDGRPDLIVLDLMLPGWSGLEILEELRHRGNHVPVLILSARDATSDKVTGLELGADDYLTKPFDLPELLARIGVMLRRTQAPEPETSRIKTGELCLDTAARSVTRAGNPVELSAKEFDMLALLVKAPNLVFSRESILEHVWGWDYEGTARTVDNFVANLRRKLALSPRGRGTIQTVPRVGYKYMP